MWNVFLFETRRGEKPVEEFIQSLDELTTPKINHHIRLLIKFGPWLSMPYSKKLTKTLYELRIRGKQEIRIIYSFKGRNIYLIHAFKKQTQRTPNKEIKVAQKRLDII
ncbi:MAG: hypothetical protein A2186_01075 [Candidatus Levybacteria bacterium RIFOXYA1_FULL_41_10]|nr:MAG: hypothetical protein UT87_C0006G0037 [Candidatus Levybacteria bacterium GW2011_GWC1_40_19]OGH27058.1 MAG: hypothetical protein A3D82_02395 [Candidatus Levybacteria bacterium RIFCSPHIGHO2_02_FULL_40_29]OGH50729.1 MAG: hypothetical protein A3J18_01025 [Candidatus Levybacteria bacterium RIFCSPLOWO2_02_FULL_40_18]OGH53066.1 MAG: hypothetical protein A3H20_03440 [Candidatus Levybacteria bacterium RIFCSPLOWO2_12_FULL_41_12]OGH55002.1 MAG: hypothetical protein A2423_03295 [Candidatus Levybacte